MSRPASARVAAVDCGTNTIKLLVADLDAASGTEIEILRTARTVRLGQGVDANGCLHPDALRRVFAAADEFASLIAEADVSAVRFCATSAVRDSSNAAEFTQGIHDRLAVVPEVLTGAQEAELSYRGATRRLREPLAPTLVVDIGGGSTECIVGDGPTPQAGWSLDIGSVRLTERLLVHDPPTSTEIAAARELVNESLDGLVDHGVDLLSARTVIAVSGTGLTVAALALGLASLDATALQGALVGVPEVHKATATLLASTVAERRAIPAMTAGREDVIGAGALILDEVLRRTHVRQMTTSVSDILDGIAWSLLESQSR